MNKSDWNESFKIPTEKIYVYLGEIYRHVTHEFREW